MASSWSGLAHQHLLASMSQAAKENPEVGGVEKMTKPAEREKVWWIEWDDKPPFHHMVEVALTPNQYQIYRRLQDDKSLRDACDYAVKVGRKEISP